MIHKRHQTSGYPPVLHGGHQGCGCHGCEDAEHGTVEGEEAAEEAQEAVGGQQEESSGQGHRHSAAIAAIKCLFYSLVRSYLLILVQH